MVSWVVWLIVAAVLGVAELLTMTLAFGLIAVAAVVAAAVGAFHLGLAIQLAAFVAAAGAGLGFIRPVAIKHVKQPPPLRTGTAALVGRPAIVLEEVTGHGGRVRIGGEEWSSRAYDEELVIPVGAKVDVWEIDGATAVVHPRELSMVLAVIIIVAVFALFVFVTVARSIRIVPQARARNVERFGRYTRTLEPGMNVIVPFIDRVKKEIDLREQVVSFKGQPVITEDNLVVLIDTVLFFQVTDPRAADYEIVNYIQAIEQITATMLRSVIGSMDLEQTLTSRDKINNMLRGVLDDASGKWGIRVTRVEIKAIDPPKSVKDAMEKQMRAEREKRAAILTAEGVRQSKILTAEGEKQSAILTAEGEKQSAILRAEGQAQAISTVFQAVHDNDPDPKLLAYQYLQTLPKLAEGAGNTFWVIPSEVTSALKMVTNAFSPGEGSGGDGADNPRPKREPAPEATQPLPETDTDLAAVLNAAGIAPAIEASAADGPAPTSGSAQANGASQPDDTAEPE
jgi:regulator of protease activity HflC (stomatin/prohibitin superfamily)/membrane protein implicated in regulation of membrane protease activity